MAVPRTSPGPELSARERFQLMERLFDDASVMDAMAARAYLDAECGDDVALRAQVEALLESADKTLAGLQQPVHLAAQAFSTGAFVGRHIGNYELLRLIGEGGMGDVYLAARADNQFQRHVAIKLLRAGVEQNQNALSRFRAERQILANLDHPNIARMLDGGVTPEGWPYLVMELVEGAPLDEYCRRAKLSTAQRLKLFCTICAAVECAHRNLIVHRDLKPANILVTAQGVPKLLDFGIAKLLDPGEGPLEATSATQRMMTPEYASPEQILGKPVTTGTDVFSLGVVLYELLCGQKPFITSSRNRMEIVRLVCEQNPEPPSALGVAKDKWSSELDSIVLKAMSKSPEARYHSVEAFASDVGAYLEGRPVSIFAGDWRYAAAKFLRRRRAQIVLAVLLAVLIGCGIAMALLVRRAGQKRLEAERKAHFLAGLFQAPTVETRSLLDKGAKRVDAEFADAPAARASLLRSMAEGYQSLALFDEAAALAERSYRLTPRDGDSLFLLANLIRLKGEFAKAEPLFRELVELRRQTVGEHDLAYAQALSGLGECLYLQTKDGAAEPLLRKALAIDRQLGPDYGSDARNYLALLLERKGDPMEAVALLREALEIDRHTTGPESPNYTISLHNLSSALIDLGDLSGAEAKLRETLVIRRRVMGDGNPELAYTLNNLGYVLIEKGDWQAAEPFVREALALNTAKLGEKHPSVAANLNNWARLQEEKGDYAAARKYFTQALEILRQANALGGFAYSQVLLNLGILEFEEGHYGAAETMSRQCLDFRRKRGDEQTPGVAAALLELGEDQLFQGYVSEAVPLLRQALEIRKSKLPAKHPAVVAAEVRLGEALIAAGDKAGAEVVLRQAMESARSAPFPLLPWQIAEAESALAACLRQTSKENVDLRAHPRAVFREPAAVRLAHLKVR